MIKTIAEHLIHLLVVLPIIIWALKKRSVNNIKVLIAFSVFFLINGILVHLPLEFENLNIFTSQWNWAGKAFGIIGSIIFVLFYKKFSLKDYYLTTKQDKGFLKTGILVVVVVLIFQSALGFFTGSSKPWDLETILYQLTMPGIEEEIAYRGIMLGLLVQVLKPQRWSFIHPAIVVTALLFGMAHGLVLNESFRLSFRMFPFFNTMLLGLVWGWITMKSGSIILALISHNLGNVVQNLIRMR
ncbi:CPBP family intramembrane glutamic endopeptidase [Flagellimonas sp.]|uniref:CPBP family intramembrane glutamic endopeptidase n=1 Tax=Flagellimonas sp. TaxID=2058762 RepID=UPI003B5B4848